MPAKQVTSSLHCPQCGTFNAVAGTTDTELLVNQCGGCGRTVSKPNLEYVAPPAAKKQTITLKDGTKLVVTGDVERIDGVPYNATVAEEDGKQKKIIELADGTKITIVGNVESVDGVPDDATVTDEGGAPSSEVVDAAIDATPGGKGNAKDIQPITEPMIPQESRGPGAANPRDESRIWDPLKGQYVTKDVVGDDGATIKADPAKVMPPPGSGTAPADVIEEKPYAPDGLDLTDASAHGERTIAAKPVDPKTGRPVEL